MAATRKLTTGAVVPGDTWVDLVDAEVDDVWLHTVNHLTGVAGTSTVYTATATPDFAADTLTLGVTVVFAPHVTCGASPTLNIDAVGAFPITKPDGSSDFGTNVVAGDLVAHNPYLLQFRNTHFMLLSANQGDIDAVADEVIAARSGKASLDIRIDGIVPDSINAATAGTSPADTDRLTYTDSTTAFALKRINWSSLRAAAYEKLGAHLSGEATKATLVSGDDFVIGDSEDTNANKRVPWSTILINIRSNMGVALILGSTPKATIVDSDDFPISDSEAANATKRVAWSTLKRAAYDSVGSFLTGEAIKTTLVNGDDFLVGDSEAANANKQVSWGTLQTNIRTALGPTLIGGATAKSALAVGDDFPIADSSATDATKKVSWAIVLDGIKAALGPTLVALMPAKTAPVDADNFLLSDSAAGDASKRITWANLKLAAYDSIGPLLTGETVKSTLVAGDDFFIGNSEAGNANTRIQWSNLLTNLRAALGPTLIGGAASKAVVAAADELAISDSAAGNVTKKVSVSALNLAAYDAIGPLLTGEVVKSTLVAGDDFFIGNSEAGNANTRIQYSNLLTNLRTALGPTLIEGSTNKATVADGDDFAISDSEAANATKRVSYATLKADLGTTMAGQAEFDALRDEVTLARSGAGTLDNRIDGIAADVTTLETQLADFGPEVIAPQFTKTWLADDDSIIVNDTDAAAAVPTKRLTWELLRNNIASALGTHIISDSFLKTWLADNDKFLISDSAEAAVVKTKAHTWAQLLANIQEHLGPRIIGTAFAKTTLANADNFVIEDSDGAAAVNTKRIEWSGILANLRTALGPTLIGGATAKTTIVDGDDFALSDSAAGNATKRIAWSTIKAAIAADTETALDNRTFDSGLDARPGDSPNMFTETLLGAYEDTAPISGIPAALDTDGEVLRVPGAHKIAARVTFRIEPSHAYKVRGIVRRRINAVDPSNDAVALKIQWLNTSQTGSVGTTIVHNQNDLTTANGRYEMSGIVALAAGAGIDFVAPAGSIYGRAYIETFGLATTDVEVVEVTDITEAEIVDTGDAALAARVTAIESEDLPDRVEALETTTTGSDIARYKSRTVAVSAAAAGTVPGSADIIDVLSAADDMDGLARRYVRSVASSGPDWFPDLGGSFWVWAPEKTITPLGFAARSKEERWGDMPWVEDWRGHGGDPSDTGCLLAAIAAAKAAGGMRLQVPARSYTIEQTLLIDGHHIYLQGQGEGQHRSNVGVMAGAWRTRFLWDGTAGGTMVKFATPLGLERRMGGGLEGIRLDGNNFIAGRGLWLESWIGGKFHNLLVYACSESCYYTSVLVPLSPFNADTQFNDFDNCVADTFGGSGLYLTNTAIGWHLTGDNVVNTANTSLNIFKNCLANMAKGIGWRIENTDDNYFYMIGGGASFAAPEDDGYHGIWLCSSDQDSINGTSNARYNFFFGPYGKVIAKASQTGGASSGANVMYGISRANGIALPTIEAGAGGALDATLYYTESNGFARQRYLGITEGGWSGVPAAFDNTAILYVHNEGGPLLKLNSAGTINTIFDDSVSDDFVPTFSFTTPGDSVITHTIQNGQYIKLGHWVYINVDIQFNTNAYTTAAGAAVISGLPFPATLVGGTFNASVSRMTFAAGERVAFGCSGSSIVPTINKTDVLAAGATTANFLPSKTGIRIAGTGMYYAAL